MAAAATSQRTAAVPAKAPNSEPQPCNPRQEDVEAADELRGPRDRDQRPRRRRPPHVRAPHFDQGPNQVDQGSD